MFWRTYFWFYLLFSILGVISGNEFGSPLHAVIDTAMRAIVLTALFGLGHDHYMGSAILWGIAFVGLVVWDVSTAIRFVAAGHTEQDAAVVVMALELPAYAGVMLYAARCRR